MEDILFELLDCDERKERKKLVKKGLELLKAASAVPAAVEEEEEEKPKKQKKKEEEPVVEEVKKEKKSKKSNNSKDQVDEVEEEKPKKDKKQKRTLEEATETDKAVPEEDASYVADESYVEDNGFVEKKRFSRIKDEAKSFQEALIQDNTYDAVFAGTGYGAKANDKLKTVRGKDFRHEKTKKKRGSYRGGAIDDEVVNSVEFSD